MIILLRPGSTDDQVGEVVAALEARGYGIHPSRAAIAAVADGLMIEVHPQPDKALKDGPQSLKPEAFASLMHDLQSIATAVGREM